MDNVLAIILAGGVGERLGILARERTKPALPFAGRYRIIDFTLSNCVNSGLYNLAVLTQYQPRSLTEHIGIGIPWGLARPDGGVHLLQPYLAPEEYHGWCKGTADAVYQNFQFIEEQETELVLILSGDHIYKMDYTDMLKFHEKSQADVTIAITRMPAEDLHGFGTVTVDEEGQVTRFQEKVKEPKSDLVSMGIYLFKKDVLQKWLEEDAQRKSSKHDFGRNIFPQMAGNCKIFAYNFEGYWRDIGTVRSYWQANRGLLDIPPSLTFSNDWPIRTVEEQRPPALVSQRGNVVNSMICNGCVIEGCVENSILSPGVRVAKNALVKNSIIMSDSLIGQDSVIDHSILDKEVVAGAGCHIGFGDDFQPNRKEPEMLSTGMTVVGKGAKIPEGIKIGRNCAIAGNVVENDFRRPDVQSGETITPRPRRSKRRE